MNADAGAVLRTQGLSCTIGGAHIVEDVSLEVRRGEFLVVIGPNGAGKTTLFNLLTGLQRPTSGRVELCGRDITHAPPYQRARAGLGRSFQVTSLFASLSVLENARIAAQSRLGGSLKFWRRAEGSGEATALAQWALAVVGLTRLADHQAGLLSHGEKRKLDLAVALAGRPQVLLLDEPTAGMGAEDVFALVDVVRAIQDTGTTLMMVEHRMEVVVELADRIAVMHSGCLLTCGPPEKVMADEVVQTAYLGGAA